MSASSSQESGGELSLKCDLCDSTRAQWRVSNFAAYSDSARLATYLCARCGWLYKASESTPDLLALYERKGGTNTYDPIAREDNMYRSEEVFQYIDRYLKGSGKPRALLDVGGGIGQVSISFALRGWQVTIVDVGPGAPAFATMTKQQCDFMDFPATQGFDLILLSHVLEHVASPTTMLSRAVDHLRPDGVLFVEVPFEIFTPTIKRKLGDPAHVGYFQISTLREYLTKVGLKVEDIRSALGRYNERRVPVIRAIATKVRHTVELPRPRLGYLGITRLLAVIFDPRNVLALLCAKILSYRRPKSKT